MEMSCGVYLMVVGERAYPREAKACNYWTKSELKCWACDQISDIATDFREKLSFEKVLNWGWVGS